MAKSSTGGKTKLPPVPAPKPEKYLFRDTMKYFVQKELAGTPGDEDYLKSKDGQAALARARTAAESALGYTEEQAEDTDELQRIAQHLRWKREDAARMAKDTLEGDSPEVTCC